MRETQVIMEPSGTEGSAPENTAPRSGLTTIMVTTKTMAITETQTDSSFSRDLTASPMLMITRIQQPQMGAMMLDGIPVMAERPMAVPVRSPPMYANPPSVIAAATRATMSHFRGGRSDRSLTSSSASPFWVTIPSRAAISCMTMTAMTENTTVHSSA